MEGFLLLHKPAGVTSRHCVNQIFNIIKRDTGLKPKIGHAGTLDLFASGLLIIAISRTATREIDRIMKYDKTYVATAQLGQLTDTLDHTGSVLLVDQNALSITYMQLKRAIKSFGIAYEQVPPAYSALKYGGRRLSDLAREKSITPEEMNQIAQAKSRLITLHTVELQTYDASFFTVQARVSHGAYIRSLMNDIASRAGTHATTHELERAAIGPFSLSQAVLLSDITTVDHIIVNCISVENMLLKIAEYKT